MPEKYVINVDLAKVRFSKPGDETKTETRTLGWGDVVEINNPDQDITDTEVNIKWTAFHSLPDGSVEPVPIVGKIIPSKGSKIKPRDVVIKKSESQILKVDFVDVQQGDGAVIETPAGKIVLIDGGDNQLFARYLANRFRNSSAANPCKIDCMLVTHGDADHFAGLAKIRDSESSDTPRKRLFLCPRRVYHNGLVKRPGKKNGRDVPDKEMLGATKTVRDPETGKNILLITEFETNLTTVNDAKMNEPFKRWKKDLQAYNQRLQATEQKDIEFRRLEFGDKDAFNFLSEDDEDKKIKVEVLAPILTEANGTRGLRFLRNPPKGPRTSEEFMSIEDKEFSKSLSASHTINGHSIVFQLRYGDFTFLFSGDLNDEAERILTKAHNRNEINLQADVFKVPHHGSHDFSGAFVQAVAPIISLISSGDESARKEYIHPRATILGALGRFSRVDEPIIFITELVAFFQTEGWMRKQFHQLTDKGSAAVADDKDVVDPRKHDFYAFSRAAFGLVMVRTDGKRLLVYTNSALEDMKEAYAFEINEFGKPEPAMLRQA
ncbi:MAG TPA: MBL fold metallo-hydrolase [Pyrinomonadaceae bacterium]|jgi:ribonuclease BN (tRNA processing enzyme)